MKKYENFNESVLGKIPIMEFIEPFTKNKFFFEEEMEESFKKYPNNIISEYIMSDHYWDYWSEDKNFPYKYIKSWCEPGSGHEETCFCVIKRKSDSKLFKIWMHDAGFIGPSTLTLCEYAVETK
jgi:hypothetical protein